MRNKIFSIFSSFLYVVLGVIFFREYIFAQDNKDIYFKYCVAHPKDACFNPIQGAVDTVGRDVAELGGGYLFCLKIDTVNAGIAPIRVILVIDRSNSMCGSPRGNACCVPGDGSGLCMSNDVNDMRIKAAETFVDSLAAKNPQSEVGVVPFSDRTVQYNPIPLNTPENIERVKRWIYEASCEYVNQQRLMTQGTFIGLGLQTALQAIDYQYNNLPKNMKRHIIILTDGAWDDYSTRGPDTLIKTYKSRYPDRAVPVIHGVFLSDSALHVAHGYPPLGCSRDGFVTLDHLERATMLGDTQGVFMSGSQPHTVVENFLTILRTMISYEPQRLVGMVVTNTTNNTVRSHKRIDTIPESNPDTVQYKATIDNLPLEFGPNVLTVQRIIKRAGTDKLDTITSTVTIFRTKEWTTNVDPTSEEYQLYCVKDSTKISITVTPPVLMINNPFTVTSTIQLKEKFILDTVEVRVFTQFPDSDPHSIAVFHLERNLKNSVNGSEATGNVAYSEIDPVFGNTVISQGSFSTPVGVISGNFALEAWIKPTAAVKKTDIFTGTGFSFGIDEKRYLYFNVDGKTVAVSAVPVDVNSWSHVAVSRVDGQIILFINGVNVSLPVEFKGAISGAVTITCPVGGYLDEVRISNAHRLRADSKFYRLDIPSLQKPTWIIAGKTSNQPVAILTPEMWNNGNIQFQFSSPVSGKLVVNFQHKGSLETQWSKNGNQVFASADLQGPYVKKAIYTVGPLGSVYDTMKVIFSEPVRCDSLKKNLNPEASFQIYSQDRVLKEGVLKGSYYVDGDKCGSEYITEVTLLVKASVNGIVPKKDSIKLVGIAVDTAGNYPDTTKLGGIEYGPGSEIKIIPITPTDGPVSPMRVTEGISARTGIPAGTEGKVIVIPTRGPLVPIEIPGKEEVSYGKAIIYDAVANVIAVDLPIKQFPENDRLYYILWDGTNRQKRKVASGTYLLKIIVQYANEPEKYVVQQKKFTVKWK